MNRRVSPALCLIGITALLLFGFLFSCSESPTDQNIDSDVMTGSGDIDPNANGDILLSDVDLGPDFPGRLEVWAVDLETEGDSVVSFDLVLVNKTEFDLYPPIHFVITKIVPNSVSVLNPDGYVRDRLPFFDFSEKLGDDGVLTPGERTARVNVRFGWPEPAAFSIGFTLSIGQPPLEGVIAGIVFKDLNRNGIYDGESEPGVPNIAVALRAASGDTRLGRVVHTDRLGRYGFRGLHAGVYEVAAMGLLGMSFTSPNPILVTLVELPDGTVSSFTDADFGTTPLYPPIERFFGPAPVGPGSELGTHVDSSFVVPPPVPTDLPRPHNYFVRVEPPMLMGPRPIYITEADVSIDGQSVFEFECRGDSLCLPPVARVLLEPPGLAEGEHMICIDVLGSEGSFLLISVEREELR
jgi:hypothetical protein